MLGVGKEGCQGHRGAPGWLGGTALHWVWSAQIPGSGRNLALSVWLSPDTRGPATKEPRQNNLALAGAGQGQRVRATLFRAWGRRGVGPGGRARMGMPLSTGCSASPGDRAASGDFQGRGFTLT